MFDYKKYIEAFSEVQIAKDDPDRSQKKKEEDVDLKAIVKDDTDLGSK